MNAKIACCLLVLTGCATKPVVETRVVTVPVSVPCKTPAVARPNWDIDKLPQGSDIYKQVKALLSTLEQHLGYETRLEAEIAACQK